MSLEPTDPQRNDSTPTPPSQSQQATEPPPSPKPPKGPRIWVIALSILLIVLGFGFGTAWGPAVSSRAGELYKATFASDEDGADGSGDGEDSGAPQYYTCGMHPWVILPAPGLCPICHMELTPLDPAKFSGEISIDPVVTQNIGVRIAPVTSGPVVRTIRTVGSITYDETRVRDVNIKVSGWIENLYIDYEGAEVERGDPLFDFYSPKLYSAQSEYLTALQMHGKVGVDFLPGTKFDTERLIEDTRVQLEFFDITPEQIEELAASGKPAKTMMMRSPYDGVVIAKHVNEGMRIDPGMQVYQIADLSKVWVMVSLYEYQLPFIQEGQMATMSLPYIPGKTFEGRVIYIYPYLDERTRQVRVRLEFDNSDMFLMPGMYASIELKSTLANDRTVAPRSAVIDTGERQVAFVSMGDGKFEPRDVLMGVETENGMVEILDGLSPGEMVVISGQFLLDSESRIRESLAKMLKGDLASEQRAVVDVVGASELASLPPAASEGIRALLNRYFDIGDTLSRDTIDGIAVPARTMTGIVDDLQKVEIPDNPHFWHKHDEIATVRGMALVLTGVTDIEAARLAFADMSVAMVKLVKATGVPPEFDADVQELHCPMYREGQGGSIWLQTAGEVRNPFFGTVMLDCFDSRSGLPVTGQGAAETPPASEPPTGASASLPMSVELSADSQAAVDTLVQAYLTMQGKLTEDDLAGAAAQVSAIHGALAQLESSSPPEPIMQLVSQLHGNATLDGASLKTFREGFRGLSDTMIELVRISPPSESVAPVVYRMYCPMKKADWLQTGKDVANPYAPSMLRCGSIKEEIMASASKGASR